MTKLEKTYGFRMPITAKEYAKGNRYCSIRKSGSEKSSGLAVFLLDKTDVIHDSLGKVRKTTKHLHLHSRLPGIIRRVIPNEACILTETSYYNDINIHTTYVNNHFDVETFGVVVETFILDKAMEESEFLGMNAEFIDLEMEKEVGEAMVVYKKIKVEVNSCLIGWIANEIEKSLRNMIIEHHQLILNTKNEWRDVTHEELEKLENEVFDYKEFK